MALSDDLKPYKLYDKLTIVEGAALIVGIPPSAAQYADWNGGGYYLQGEYSGFESEFNAIMGALLNALDEPNNNTETKVTPENIREWLISKNWASEFFGTTESQSQQIESGYIPPYLDPKHEHYSPELAGAVYAWLAFDGLEVDKGLSVKEVLTDWIQDNLKGLDFSGKAVERVSMVVNWKQTGGAPPTTSERIKSKTLEDVQACFKPMQPITKKNTVKLKPINYTPPPKFFDDDIPY
ncbi:MAG: hypothetical protein WCS28_10400 [Thiomicrospira sp.]